MQFVALLGNFTNYRLMYNSTLQKQIGTHTKPSSMNVLTLFEIKVSKTSALVLKCITELAPHYCIELIRSKPKYTMRSHNNLHS